MSNYVKVYLSTTGSPTHIPEPTWTDVTSRVLASEGLPRYYDTDGPPQIAIVVCSGRRLGPGNWEKRTVWFASPQV